MHTRRSDVRREAREPAYDREPKVLALIIADREAITRAHDDPPDLPAEHEAWLRQGLV